MAMDSLITAAARALAAGDPLGALNRVALRGDAPALALRGIAMAQLGDLVRAKALLRSAARAFGPREAVARARCAVAAAEIALVSRDLGWREGALDAARATLEAHGDRANAAHARYLAARRLLLIGRLDAAERMLACGASEGLPAAGMAGEALVVAGIAIRRIRATAARAALARAGLAARAAGIPALIAEVEALLASPALVVDACRHVVREGPAAVSLSRRPILFALARALGEAWPADVPRAVLVARAFGGKVADESHRARLRVEVGRLRGALGTLAEVHATRRGFVLRPRGTGAVVVLAPPVDDRHAAVLALLADGEAWSSSALSLALATGQRTVQRALDALAAAGKVQSFGRGRARRWTMPSVPGFPTALLLSVPLPSE